MQIARACIEEIQQHSKPNKVLIIYGARRVGKTELLKTYLKRQVVPGLWLHGDDTQA